MNTISAQPSFSIARKLAIVSLALWMGASPVLACGPEYNPHDDMYTSYHYDPASLDKPNTNYVFEQFIIQGMGKEQLQQWQMRGINSRRVGRDYFAELNSALKQEGRKITLVDPSASSLFKPSFCYRDKYRNELKDRFYYLDFEKIKSGLIPRNSAGVNVTLPRDSARSSFDYCPEAGEQVPDLLADWPAVEKQLLTFDKDSEFYFSASVALFWGNFIVNEREKAATYLDILKGSSFDTDQRSFIDALDIVYKDPMTERSDVLIKLNIPSEYDTQYAGLRPFMLAVIRDKSLNDETAADLMYKRDLLYKTYKSQIKDVISAHLATPENDYDRYLLAAAYFYMEYFSQAKPLFAQLAKEDDFPLAEASLYSLARLERGNVETPVQAIYNAHDEADRAIQERAYLQANKDAGNRAYQAYQIYLKQYPDGQYVREADGMLRRCLWLAERWEEYIATLKQHADANFKQILADPEWTNDEIEKLMSLMEEYQYASRMRTGEFDRSEEDQVAKMSALNPLDLIFPFSLRSKLKPEGGKQRSILRLYDYLDMLAAYQKGDSASVIKKYGEWHPLVGMNSPERLLYVRALEQDKQYDKALAFWKSFYMTEEDYNLSNNAGLEMASIVVIRDGIKGLFAMDMIEDRIKLNYLATLCDEKQQLEWLKDTSVNEANKHVLFADIATRYLYQQRLKELHALYQQYPDSILQEFSGIRTALKQVNDGQSLGKAYMNIGYFMKVSLQPLITMPAAIDAEVLETCRRTVVKDGAFGPYYYFNLAASQFGDTNDEAEAKLLHFLTLCGKIGDEGKNCKWGYEGKEERLPWGYKPESGITSEQAFKKLHQKYPGSKWAEQTPYHY